MTSLDFDDLGLNDSVAEVISGETERNFQEDDEFEIIDEYELSDFAKAMVVNYIPSGTKFYWVDDPDLTEAEREITYKSANDVEEYLREVSTGEMTDDEIRDEIQAKSEEFIKAHLNRQDGGYFRYIVSEDSISTLSETIGLGEPEDEQIERTTEEDIEKMVYFVERELLDFGKLTPIIEDPHIEDISCNGPYLPVYLYHNKYGNIPTNVVYDDEELHQFVLELSQRADKHISVANPDISGRTRDGYRIQLTLSDEVSPKGSNFTIRKYKEEPFTPVDLIEFGTFSVHQMAYLWLAIENRKSLIFAGGTASGKTTSMNAISMFIPPGSKIVTIEDTQEISLQHSNWIQSTTRESFGSLDEGEVSMYDLLRDALRQRPEYIIVGEIRGEEARTLFQAMNTGHTTYSTMHADSVKAAVDRLKNEPINVSKQLINALDIISIQVRKTVNGDIERRCSEMVEVENVFKGEGSIKANPVYEYDNSTDEINKVADSHILEDIRIESNWTEEELEKELSNRMELLNALAQIDQDLDYLEVSSMLRKYYQSPKETLEEVKNGDIHD